MAKMTRLVVCLLLAPFASANTKKVLLWAAARSPEDPTAETLNEIDANQDGHIDPSEVASFAQSEGLDTASATDDFSGIDTNGDGTIDPAELIQVVGTGSPAVQGSTTTRQAMPLAPVPKGALHVISGPAAEKPALRATGKHQPHIGIQATHTARAPTPKNVKAVPTAKVVVPATAEPAPVLEVVKKPATDGAKPTPVERMVKHFAQVLRTADVVPVRAETLTPTAAPVPDLDPRAMVQSAAKEVAEQLHIAEAAESQARILDRKAAEELANATVLAKLTTQEALNAGAAAAHTKANELLAKVSKLEDQAERAQVRSAALHSKAKLETDEASELMSVADRALNHSPKSRQPL